MFVSEFDYELPEELIAQKPPEDRAGARMLVLSRSTGRWEDRWFRDLPALLKIGDCLVLNDSKVFPSRLLGVRSSGPAQVEVFLIRALSGDHRTWQALVRPGRKLPVGERIQFSGDLACEIVERSEHGERTIRFDGGTDVFAALDLHGHMPLPPYIRRPDLPEDRERYNTTFASVSGSVAAPTAGLHFTPEILDACRQSGTVIGHVTLHVGLGTFAPLREETLEQVVLHSERYAVNPNTMQSIRCAQRRICVGTTSVRTVETAYRTGKLVGDTSLFISPGYEFLAVDGMLTNFHLPQSSLLILVAAFAGREFILDAYRYAVNEKYRFFSYGDCMLIV
ncbi:MAG: tRNA preQ1(34) S-adenosylmethionine ribosyltransferase-isomerase QueA [Bryobacteraceae bacterium]|nr:tRNA preQ1(34) S-adenosylmethionine ribosyltransferase-isomerase QueA [Bryobacteraceae bacterium]